MLPAGFIAKWKKADWKERSGAREPFIDLCRRVHESRSALRSSRRGARLKFLANENIPSASVVLLRQTGIDVLHVAEDCPVSGCEKRDGTSDGPVTATVGPARRITPVG